MFGLQFIAVNFLYLVFSLFIGIIIYIILAKKEKFASIKRISIGIGTFLVVWMLPYYDLFIQKGIKTYYETFKMNNTIYAYPERDKDGKIESLGVGRVNSFPIGFFISEKQSKKVFFSEIDKNSLEVKDYFHNWFQKYISDYLEIGIYDNADQIRLFRILYYLSPYIEPTIKQTARYQIFEKRKVGIFGLYQETLFEFKDMKHNRILASAWFVYFPVNKDAFRNSFLLWRGPSGIAFSISNTGNIEEIFERLFNFHFKVGGHSIKYNEQGKGERQ